MDGVEYIFVYGDAIGGLFSLPSEAKAAQMAETFPSLIYFTATMSTKEV